MLLGGGSADFPDLLVHVFFLLLYMAPLFPPPGGKNCSGNKPVIDVR